LYLQADDVKMQSGKNDVNCDKYTLWIIYVQHG
jgi:hypothetical protein